MQFSFFRTWSTDKERKSLPPAPTFHYEDDDVDVDDDDVDVDDDDDDNDDDDDVSSLIKPV